MQTIERVNLIHRSPFNLLAVTGKNHVNSIILYMTNGSFPLFFFAFMYLSTHFSAYPINILAFTDQRKISRNRERERKKLNGTDFVVRLCRHIQSMSIIVCE